MIGKDKKSLEERDKKGQECLDKARLRDRYRWLIAKEQHDNKSRHLEKKKTLLMIMECIWSSCTRQLPSRSRS
jgi:hypothetical protein